jgi:acetoin utilization deacetylase AcuC-like enzyme
VEAFSAMTTLLFTHPACRAHDPGPHHPESPRRLDAVIDALKGESFAALEWREAEKAPIECIARAHPEAWIGELLGLVPEKGYAAIDADTIICPASGNAALLAAGALCEAVDAVARGEAHNAFCAVRPPGHHAEPTRAMGFCLFNNVAIGAFHARAEHRIERVAVIDFDVHHGNGTQAMFERDPSLFYASTHQWPLYPGTGAREERGVGNLFNLPLPPGAGSAEFRAAMRETILPALRDFAPGFVLISAGFDGHRDDPLAELRLVDEDYEWATAEIAGIAAELCKGRVVSTLEGGYDLTALGKSAAAHVRALMAA